MIGCVFPADRWWPQIVMARDSHCFRSLCCFSFIHSFHSLFSSEADSISVAQINLNRRIYLAPHSVAVFNAYTRRCIVPPQSARYLQPPTSRNDMCPSSSMSACIHGSPHHTRIALSANPAQAAALDRVIDIAWSVIIYENVRESAMELFVSRT